MALNTEKNSYTLLFAIGLVVIVGTLLASVDASLKDKIRINKLLEKQHYRNDLDLVNIELKKNNFHILDFKEKNNWISAKYYYISTPR